MNPTVDPSSLHVAEPESSPLVAKVSLPLGVVCSGQRPLCPQSWPPPPTAPSPPDSSWRAGTPALRSWQIPTRLKVFKRPNFKALEHPLIAHCTVSGMLPGWISVISGTRGPESLNPGLRQRGRSRVKIRALGALSCKRGGCAGSVHLARRPLLLHGAWPASALLYYGSGNPGLSARLSNLKLPGKPCGTRRTGAPSGDPSSRPVLGSSALSRPRWSSAPDPAPAFNYEDRGPLIAGALALWPTTGLPTDGKRGIGHVCSSFARSLHGEPGPGAE